MADIGQLFNAVDYCLLAEQALQVSGEILAYSIVQSGCDSQDIIKRGRVPMVIGGTGLYIKTLIEGPHGAPPSTLESRAHIDKLIEEEDGGVWEVR